MENLALFKDIKEVGLDELLGYLDAKPVVYKKGDVIIEVGQRLSNIACVLVGAVKLCALDLNGKEIVLGYANENETFCVNYLCSGMKKSPVRVIAERQCGVLLIPYKRLLEYNEPLSKWQGQMLGNLFKIIADENAKLNERMFLLEKRNIREKVLFFLKLEAARAKERSFEIPFSREELAQYLCVDRCALSRELSNLHKEEVIFYRKNVFTLLKTV